MEWIAGIENEGGFSSDVGGPSDDGRDFLRVWQAGELPAEARADDAGLSPGVSFGEFSGGGEAGEFGAGAGAAG